MIKKRFLFASMFTAMFTFSNVDIMAEHLDLIVGIVNPKETQIGKDRSPVSIPEVDLDNYTLSFITPCDGCILRLLNEYGEVAYTTVINTTSLVLPSNLSSGDYRIEIIRGNFCFWGYISL